MLNITPAEAEATAVQTAGAYAAQAATRPLAGLGAGAFTCAGTWAGSSLTGIAAGKAQAGAVGVAYETKFVDIVQVDSVQRDIQNGITHNSIQTARPYPATPGGVGPHPAREPVPV
jgi:hypothetical protein